MDNLVTQTILSNNERDQLGLQNVQIETLENAFGTLMMFNNNPPDMPIPEFVRLSNQDSIDTSFDFEYFGETFRNLNVRNIVDNFD